MNYKNLLVRYREPCLRKALFQLLNTLVPLAFLWGLMWCSLEYHYAITLLLAVPAAGLLVRVFMIQHDCGHLSFFRSPRANHIVGFALSLLTMTTYHCWRRNHVLHHATSGDLDQRGHGDIRTLTIAEYLCQPPWQRLAYRIYRHPVFLLGIAPMFYFVIGQRFSFRMPPGWTRERYGLHATNALLLLLFGTLAWLIGVQALLLLYLPVAALASSVGMWLFFIQHSYEDAYWQRDRNWDFAEAALLGSSHYDLPRVLQWFTANIGLHHLHHLDSRIPNYRLHECAATHPEIRAAHRLTFWESLPCIRLALWDERQGQLIRFRDIKDHPPRSAVAVVPHWPDPDKTSCGPV